MCFRKADQRAFEIFPEPSNGSNHKALGWWARQGSNL
jgi:hypothetical protein